MLLTGCLNIERQVTSIIGKFTISPKGTRTMMRAKIATCALLLACSLQVNAASLPDQGSTMSRVEQNFGSPLKKSGPVGSPPISRWEYDSFVVVFERNRVVHSFNVTGGRANSAPTPAPSSAPAAAETVAPAATPAPAPRSEPAPTAPAATNGVDAAEQARRQAERDAMRKAREQADADARARADAAAREQAAEAARIRTEAEAAADAAKQRAQDAAVQSTAPAGAPAEAAPKSPSGFTFDPVTGRVILK